MLVFLTLIPSLSSSMATTVWLSTLSSFMSCANTFALPATMVVVLVHPSAGELYMYFIELSRNSEWTMSSLVFICQIAQWLLLATAIRDDIRPNNSCTTFLICLLGYGSAVVSLPLSLSLVILLLSCCCS